MKLVVLALALLLLPSCVVNMDPYGSDVPIIDHPEDVEIIKNIIHERVSKNGATAFCTQRGVQKCLNVTEEQCETDLNKHVEPCSEYAISFIGDGIKRTSFMTYGNILAECMFSRRQADYLLDTNFNDVEDPTNCINESLKDSPIFLRNLIK